MNKPKRHHFVPQFFQRNWLSKTLTNDHGYSCVFSLKNNKLITEKGLKKVLMVPYLYSMPNKRPNDTEYLETKYFGRIDNFGAIAIQSLINHSQTKYLDFHIKKFICALFIRTPDIINGLCKQQNCEKEDVLYQIPCTVKYLYNKIYRNKPYYLLKLKKTNTKFFTGDFPLHITNDDNDVMLAISPTIAIYTDKELLNKYKEDDIVTLYNNTVCSQSKTVLSCDKI